MEITTKAKNPKAAGVKKSKVAAANAKAKAAEITIGNECTEGTEGVEGIYGIYDGNYGPRQIVVDKGNEEIDGIYEYKCRGSLGMIYLNLEKGIILKAQPCDIVRGWTGAGYS